MSDICQNASCTRRHTLTNEHLDTLAELRADRTQYDKGRKRSGRSGRSGKRSHADSTMYRPILAIDGEGITDHDGRHRYVMLACSTGEYIAGRELPSESCLDYLLDLPQGHLIVGFSISYDVAKWLSNVPKQYLADLWASGSCRWGKYRIRYAPGKHVNISDGARSVQIWDVFGYYQHSFVASLEEWNVGTAEQVERIRAMKASRSDFSDESTSEMLAYCLEECELLVQLVGKLRDALIVGDIPMSRWDGAGAIASAIMRKEGVKQYVERQPPERYSVPILSGYFGGRFEVFESGEHRNIWLYDIRSAYPYIASELPCQTHMVYRPFDGWEDAPYAIYHCCWNLPPRTAWPPFPFRHAKTRQILYPYRGEGWYYASEVRAAMRLYPAQIEVLDGIAFDTHCPSNCTGRPFGFIPEYYAFRNRLKVEGSQAQLTIKLGLNSIYGKTAQGVGYGEHKPPFQSYLYAGMITAGTRAMLLDAIGQSPENIIWTATDGIASKRRLNLNVGDDLGEWEETFADWVFCVQPGVYQVSKDGQVQTRSRGFGRQETDFDSIRAAYLANPVWGEFKYSTSRFIGLGGALMRRDFWGYFGRWLRMDRTVKFLPSKRIPELLLDAAEMGLSVEDVKHMTAIPPIRSWPPPGVQGQGESAPYAPKSSWTDQWDREADNEDALELLIDNEQP